MPKSIVMIGTIDTKGDQIEYLKHQIEGRRHKTTMIDVGVLGAVPFKPTISREEVAEATGSTLKDVIALNDNFLAMTKMAEGASKLVKELCSKGALEGIIAVGGSQGTELHVFPYHVNDPAFVMEVVRVWQMFCSTKRT